MRLSSTFFDLAKFFCDERMERIYGQTDMNVEIVITRTLWDFNFIFIPIHYQEAAMVKRDFKFSEKPQRIQISRFGAHLFSLG